MISKTDTRQRRIPPPDTAATGGSTDTLHLLFTAVTVIFIAATMFAAGLGATLSALRGTVANLPLLGLALVANLVIIPLLGHRRALQAVHRALHRTGPGRVIPGGPFGAELAMVQKGDLVAGAAMQVLLASIGSITFGPTANAILTAATVGGGISLDVGALVRTVAILQLVPFAVGLILRRSTASIAGSWHPAAAKVSNITFLIVLAGMLLLNWRDVVALLGSFTLLAGFLLAIAAFATGTLLATGSQAHRTTMGGVAAVRNAGPALAAIGIAFNNESAILGALAAVLLSGLVASIPAAAVLSRRRGDQPRRSFGNPPDSPRRFT